MTAPVAKPDLALRVSDRMSVAGPPASSRRLPTVFLATLRWLTELPRRRAAMDELNNLTDHELADIGLSRADIQRVFDPRFIAERLAADSHIQAARG
jgi:uncharacterized protein YjiS (DUF1127 family)